MICNVSPPFPQCHSLFLHICKQALCRSCPLSTSQPVVSEWLPKFFHHGQLCFFLRTPDIKWSLLNIERRQTSPSCAGLALSSGINRPALFCMSALPIFKMKGTFHVPLFFVSSSSIYARVNSHYHPNYWPLGPLKFVENFWMALHLVSNSKSRYKENNALDSCSTLKTVVLIRKSFKALLYFPS